MCRSQISLDIIDVPYSVQVEVKAMWLGKKDESQVSLRDRMVDSVMGVRKPTFKRSYQPTRFNSNYLFHSISIMMVYFVSVFQSRYGGGGGGGLSSTGLLSYLH